MHVNYSINTSHDISVVQEITVQGRMNVLITPFKPCKYTLLVNILNVKGYFVFLKKVGHVEIFMVFIGYKIFLKTTTHTSLNFKVEKARILAGEKKNALVFHWHLVEVCFTPFKIKLPKEGFKRSSCIFNLRG